MPSMPYCTYSMQEVGRKNKLQHIFINLKIIEACKNSTILYEKMSNLT